MYILTTSFISNNNSNSKTYVQLRDNDMRLVAFFNIKNILEALKNVNLQHLYFEINNILEKARVGNIYKLN